MRINVNPGALKQTNGKEHAARFVLGGLVTATAGLIAKHYGPVVGGLFLAFPAIFPASATLIETHEKRKKSKAGLDGTARAREAASLDARGTALGCVGLMVFAGLLWRWLPGGNAATGIVLASLVWFGCAAALWWASQLPPRSRFRAGRRRWTQSRL